MQEEGSRSAVAFWGNGAAKKLNGAGNGDFRIICNLASGGTNPFEIEKMKRANVRQCDRLHAKVYVGSKTAIVTSANVSANGLGLEAIEQAFWIEAGYFLEDKAEFDRVTGWFNSLWEKSRQIKDSDLDGAKEKWNERRRPSVLSIAEFDPEREDTPLLDWWDGTYSLDPIKKKQKEYGLTDDQFSHSWAMPTKENCDGLNPGKWILI